MLLEGVPVGEDPAFATMILDEPFPAVQDKLSDVLETVDTDKALAEVVGAEQEVVTLTTFEFPLVPQSFVARIL